MIVKKYLLILLGTIAFSLGIIGLFLPILPTTPFLLLASYCYLRSSKKLYRWMIKRKVIGKYIYSYLNYRAVEKSAKIFTIAFLWATLIVSIIFINNIYIRILLTLIGIGVSTHIIKLKTLKEDIMPNIEETIKNLKKRGFSARHFSKGTEAVEYLKTQLKNKTIGFGGSMTLEALNVFQHLSENNQVFWHWKQDIEEARKNSANAEVYISSANAIAKTGEIINIDGTGNRVASTLYGKKKVYFIVGSNKLADDYEKALSRARNIAAPLNARRFQVKTPCATGELKCHDCESPDRICKGLVVLWGKMFGMEEVEVIIIDEELGF